MRTRSTLNALACLAALLACAVGCSGTDKGSQQSSDSGQAPASVPADAAAVVGTAGDRSFTLAEIDAMVEENNYAAFRVLHDARQGALDSMINEHLLQQEAEAQGMLPEALEEREVKARIEPVSDEKVNTFYEKNKAQVGGRPLDDMLKGQIRAYLAAQQEFEARKAFYDSLRDKSMVTQTLKAPAMLIADSDPYKGPASAPVTIVEFSDFQ